MPANALDYITIKGFKSIASVEKLELRPINVLIGPNGSGKSNFIGMFAFLHAIREGGLQDYVTAAGGAEQKGTQQAEGNGSKHSAFYCNGWGKAAGDGMMVQSGGLLNLCLQTRLITSR